MNPKEISTDIMALEQRNLSVKQVEELYGDGLPYDYNRLVEVGRVAARNVYQSMLELGKACMRIATHETKGKYEEALEHYEQLLRKGGRKAAYLDLACAAAVKAGKGMEGALPYYEEAEKKGGDRELHLETLYLLAESARFGGAADELETVRAAYEKLYPSAKEDSRFLLHYGDLLVSVKKWDEAFAMYEAGETLTAADAAQQAAFRQREAICQEYRGEYADALRRFTALLESGQGNREEIEHEIAFLKTRAEGSDG